MKQSIFYAVIAAIALTAGLTGIADAAVARGNYQSHVQPMTARIDSNENRQAADAESRVADQPVNRQQTSYQDDVQPSATRQDDSAPADRHSHDVAVNGRTR